MKLNIGDMVANNKGEQGRVIEMDDLMVRVRFGEDRDFTTAGWFDREDDNRLTVIGVMVTVTAWQRFPEVVAEAATKGIGVDQAIIDLANSGLSNIGYGSRNL